MHPSDSFPRVHLIPSPQCEEPFDGAQGERRKKGEGRRRPIYFRPTHPSASFRGIHLIPSRVLWRKVR